jgi:recombination protein RecT
MTALATQTPGSQRPVTKVDELKSIVGKMQSQFMAALATDEKRAERFTRIAQTAISMDPKLAECERSSVLGSFMQVAQLKLELDKNVGHCSIVRRWNPKLKREVATVTVEYKGYIEMARRSNEIASLMTGVVHQNDQYSRRITLKGEEFEHVPATGDRGPWTRVYSLVHFKSGGYHLEVMTREEVLDIRDQYSDGWKAYKDGKISTTPWASAETEMGRKTVIRRARKYWPLSVEDQRLLGMVERIEDAAERGAVAHAIDAETGSFQLAFDPAEADAISEASLSPEPEPPKPEVAANSRLAGLADKAVADKDRPAEAGPKAKKSAKKSAKPEPEPPADSRPPHDPVTGEIHEPEPEPPEWATEDDDVGVSEDADDPADDPEDGEDPENEFFGTASAKPVVPDDINWLEWVEEQGGAVLSCQSRQELMDWAKHPVVVAHLEVLKEQNFEQYNRITTAWTVRKQELKK